MSKLASAVAAEGLRAIPMDTMGYGDSDRPPTPYTTMSEFAQAVIWLMDGLGIEKANLLGVLTGSQIALQVAAEHPDRVNAVVTQEAFNWGTPARRAVHERIHRYHPPQDDGSHLLQIWNRSKYSPDQREHDLRMREFLYVNEAEPDNVYNGMGWEGAAPFAMCTTDMWSITPRIQAPVLLTYGPNSQLHRAMEKFLDTVNRSKGLRDAPTFVGNPAGLAKIAVDFFKNPGV